MSASHTDKGKNRFDFENNRLSSIPPISNSTKAPSSKMKFRRVQKLGSRINKVFAKKTSIKAKCNQDIISQHLSNTLGIIKLLSLDHLNAEQVANIASLKSSCDFLLEELGIGCDEQKKEQSKIDNDWNIDSNKNENILLVCSHPIQKKILKNLIQRWGYQVQVISSLPVKTELLSNMKYDLVIVTEEIENISKELLFEFNRIEQGFLILASGTASLKSEQKQFPLIQGPIDPDFLKYKINNIFQNRKLKQARINNAL